MVDGLAIDLRAMPRRFITGDNAFGMRLTGEIQKSSGIHRDQMVTLVRFRFNVFGRVYHLDINNSVAKCVFFFRKFFGKSVVTAN